MIVQLLFTIILQFARVTIDFQIHKDNDSMWLTNGNTKKYNLRVHVFPIFKSYMIVHWH